MKEPVFQGSCTALVTPFGGDGIDYQRLRSLLDFQSENGTKAVVLAGTTGENPTLTPGEYTGLVEQSIDHARGKLKLLVGVGGNNTMRCLEKAKFAQSAGADAVLMTPPYYNKSTQQGVIHHFCTVADAIQIPLILYNVPSRTAIGIAAESYLLLSQHPNINGVKEASGDFSLISRILAECGDDLNLWSGNDDQTVPMMALGAKGVVSVASNLVPQRIAALCEACLAGDFQVARNEHRKLERLFRLLFVETNPIPVKAAMEMAGLDSGLLRLPLVEIAPDHRALLAACLQELGVSTVN